MRIVYCSNRIPIDGRETEHEREREMDWPMSFNFVFHSHYCYCLCSIKTATECGTQSGTQCDLINGWSNNIDFCMSENGATAKK